MDSIDLDSIDTSDDITPDAPSTQKSKAAAAKSSSSTRSSSYKFKLMAAMIMIFFLVSTESFIHHILRKVPGAVRVNDNIPTGVGTLVQGLIMFVLWVMLDTLASNNMVI